MAMVDEHATEWIVDVVTPSAPPPHTHTPTPIYQKKKERKKRRGCGGWRSEVNALCRMGLAVGIAESDGM